MSVAACFVNALKGSQGISLRRLVVHRTSASPCLQWRWFVAGASQSYSATTSERTGTASAASDERSGPETRGTASAASDERNGPETRGLRGPSTQRRVDVKQDPRRPKSVGELHALHCERLSSSPKTADVDWQWASLRACKLADTMRPQDIAKCVTALACAQRRDIRLLFILAEEAIRRRDEFAIEDIAEMMAAYATLNVRNEPLFEALGIRTLTLLAHWGIIDDQCVGAFEQSAVDIGNQDTPSTEVVLSSIQRVISAHRTLSLEDSPALPPLLDALHVAQGY